MNPAAVLDDLTLGYGRRPAVHHLSGQLRSGALAAVVGPNGAGKSTLLKGLAGKLRPLGGSLRLAQDLTVAYLPQRPDMDRRFPLAVRDVVAMGHFRRLGALRPLNDGHWQAVHAALAAVGLDGFEARPLGSLSVGQLQRALFARLVVEDARLILLDEPFAAVDYRTTEVLLALVRQWHAQGRTVLAVLHDLEQVRDVFPETLLLAREPIAWGPTAQVLDAENLLRARRHSEPWDEGAAACPGARQ